MPSLSRRQIFGVAAACTVTAAAVLAATLPSRQAADEPSSPAAAIYREMIWGDVKAKVTIIEYASLSCSHCAHFANDIFPDIKKAYIDTGKVRFVYRDFPIGGPAMAGAMLARCAPEDQSKKLIELMFKTQDAWAASPQPLDALKQTVAPAGMSAADADACWENGPLFTAIQDEQKRAAETFRVNSTPTFLVGDEKVEGAMEFPEFSKILDKHLEKAK